MARHLARKLEQFRITGRKKVELKDFDPGAVAHVPDKEAARAATERNAEKINELQDRLFAEGTRALLVVLQGMDTSGKDGTIKAVFNRTGPLGVCVQAFKAPSEDERAHDFLWRVHAASPKRGTIGIFNRSHYEDVLIAKVKKLAPAERIEERYRQINDFERMLVENGTVILKFMLHVSKDEQRERLQERIDDPAKRWKFRAGDLDDRVLWRAYMSAYETMLNRCSTKEAPWWVIPADRRWARNAAIAAIVRRTLEDMRPSYPKITSIPAGTKVK